MRIVTILTGHLAAIKAVGDKGLGQKLRPLLGGLPVAILHRLFLEPGAKDALNLVPPLSRPRNTTMPPPRASSRVESSDALSPVIRWLFLMTVVSFLAVTFLVWQKISTPRVGKRPVLRSLVPPAFRPPSVALVFRREVSFPVEG